MIEVYTGTPGSGKSLHCAQRMVNWITKYKAPVIGNFLFKANCIKNRGWGSYLYCPNEYLEPDFLIDFCEKYKKKRRMERLPEDHILLVIDECQLIFNSREWNKPKRREWMSFFTQHRKFGYHVILVCQNIIMIDKQIRENVEYEVIHRKVANTGKIGRVASLASGGGLHVCVRIYKPLNLKESSEFFKANKKLYSLYDSYTRFDGS